MFEKTLKSRRHHERQACYPLSPSPFDSQLPAFTSELLISPTWGKEKLADIANHNVRLRGERVHVHISGRANFCKFILYLKNIQAHPFIFQYLQYQVHKFQREPSVYYGIASAPKKRCTLLTCYGDHSISIWRLAGASSRCRSPIMSSHESSSSSHGGRYASQQRALASSSSSSSSAKDPSTATAYRDLSSSSSSSMGHTRRRSLQHSDVERYELKEYPYQDEQDHYQSTPPVMGPLLAASSSDGAEDEDEEGTPRATSASGFSSASNHRSISTGSPSMIGTGHVGSFFGQSSDFLSSLPPFRSRKQRQRQRSSSAFASKSSSSRSFRPLCILVVLPIALLTIYAILQKVSQVSDRLPSLPGPKGIADLLSGNSGASNSFSSAAGGASANCACGTTSSVSGDRLCRLYGHDTLDRSLLYEGSGSRVRRALGKARKGLPLKLGVLGGSVSACHGVHPSPEWKQGDPKGPGCYTTLLQQWIHETFGHAGVEIENGAIGGMDSSYYAFCGTRHIPPDVDLIILEFDVNDQTSAIYQHFFDQLLRVLLELPSQPAVVILGAWSPLVAQDQGYADPQVVHLPIAHYYDIPYISLKRAMFNTYLRFPSSTKRSFYQPDGVHPNIRGHRVLADILIGYFERQLCVLDALGPPRAQTLDETLQTGLTFDELVDVSADVDWVIDYDPVASADWKHSYDADLAETLANEKRLFVGPASPFAVPPTPIFQPIRDILPEDDPQVGWSAGHDPPSAAHILDLIQPKPFCADANDKENPLTPSRVDGWRAWDFRGEKHYWISDTPGSRISVDIDVSEGRIAVYYFRSSHYDLGDAKCWVDDNERGAVRLTGYWSKPYNVAEVAYIDEKVTKGKHYVTCEILKETSHPSNTDAHHFRLVAVMST